MQCNGCSNGTSILFQGKKVPNRDLAKPDSKCQVWNKKHGLNLVTAGV